MDRLLQDLHFAARQLRRNAGFTAIVIATVAIGIAANTTIFSAVHELLLRPLPYADSEQLVSLSGAYVGRGDDWSVSYPNAVSWREQNRTFSELAWYQAAGFSLVSDARPERLEALRTSWTLYPLLGISPALGRTYTAEEDVPNAARVVLISYGLWQRHFGGAQTAVGSSLRLSGVDYQVVGVLPQGFSFPGPGVDLYVPVRASEQTWCRGCGGLQVLGRMRPGVNLEAVRADLQRVSAQLAEEYPEPNSELSASVRTLRERLYGAELPRILLTMLGAVGFVLLIACVNVANLLLARATSREREFGVRVAIGAGRGRLSRQLLTESLLLAVLGGGLGVLLSLWGTSVLSTALPEGVANARAFSVNGPVLLFAAALTLATGLLFGLAPAYAAGRAQISGLLVGRAGYQTRQRGRRRGMLVVAEVALALMLLVGAGLMMRSFARLLETSPGFDPAQLLTMRVGIDQSYAGNPETLAFQARVMDQVRAVAGVQSAAAIDYVPLGGTNNYGDFQVEGRDGNDNAGNLFVTEDYFAAMRIPMLRGREFDRRDARGAPQVAIISRVLADRLFGDEEPLGKRIRMSWDSAGVWRTIVGVTGNVRHHGIDSEPREEIYLPYGQLPWRLGSFTIIARVQGDPAAHASAVQNAVWSVDPNQVVYDVRTGQSLVNESDRVVLGRIMAFTIGLFALVALTLAALGLYGVISYSVAQRTYEIGVRSALGASRSGVLRMVVGQGLRLALAGSALGLMGALALSRVIASLLFGIGARDPLTFIAVPLVLVGVAALASGIPALRAARVSPLVALRSE